MYRHPTAVEIETLVRPSVESLGCDLLGVYFKPSQYGSLLRLYIDAETGVGLQECEQVSRQVSALLDVHDPIQSEYNLEVSSPGEDRPIFTLEQMQQHAGARVKLVLAESYQGRRRFAGVIERVENNDVHIVLDDKQQYAVPFGLLSEARLAPLHA